MLATRQETARRLTFAVRDASGHVPGQTVVAWGFDGGANTNKFLNLASGSWGAAKVTSPCTETPAGYQVDANLANTRAAARTIRVEFEVTAGSAAGLTAADELEFIAEDFGDKITLDQVDALTQSMLDAAVSSRSSHTAADAAAQADTVLSAAHGAGAWTGGGGSGPTEADIWAYVLPGSPGAGSAAELLLGAGGGSSPGAVATAVWAQLVADNDDVVGSFGEAVANLDAESLKALLMAAVGQLTRIGEAYTRLETIELFVGESVPIRFAVLDDGQLADLVGATVSVRFVAIDDGTAQVKTGAVSGTPGHVEYMTAPGDSIADAAERWRAQATVTLADTRVLHTFIKYVEVKPTI